MAAEKKVPAQKKAPPSKAAQKRVPSQRQRTNYAAAADRRAKTARAPDAAMAPRTKPIRVTLDLDPALHRQLKAWCNQAALDVELPSVTLAQVLRIVGDLVLTDDDIAAAVRARLQETAE